MPSENPPVFRFPQTRDAEATDKQREGPGGTLERPSRSTLLQNIDNGETAVPEVIVIPDDRLHVWYDGVHLVETDDQSVHPGKYYLMPTGGIVLYRIEDVSDELDESGENERGNEANLEDPVTVTACYALGEDEYLEDGSTQQLSGDMFERQSADARYIDPPPVPLEVSQE